MKMITKNLNFFFNRTGCRIRKGSGNCFSSRIGGQISGQTSDVLNNFEIIEINK